MQSWGHNGSSGARTAPKVDGHQEFNSWGTGPEGSERAPVGRTSSHCFFLSNDTQPVALRFQWLLSNSRKESLFVLPVRFLLDVSIPPLLLMPHRLQTTARWRVMATGKAADKVPFLEHARCTGSRLLILDGVSPSQRQGSPGTVLVPPAIHKQQDS